jgi:hypothetical protein
MRRQAEKTYTQGGLPVKDARSDSPVGMGRLLYEALRANDVVCCCVNS